MISSLAENSASRATPLRLVPTVGSVVPLLERPAHTASTAVTFTHLVQTAASLGEAASSHQRAALDEYDDEMHDDKSFDEDEDAKLDDGVDQFDEFEPQMAPDAPPDMFPTRSTGIGTNSTATGRTQLRDSHSHLPPLLSISQSDELDKPELQEDLNSDSEQLENSSGAQTASNALACDLCGAEFGSERMLQKHRRNQHPVLRYCIPTVLYSMRLINSTAFLWECLLHVHLIRITQKVL